MVWQCSCIGLSGTFWEGWEWLTTEVNRVSRDTGVCFCVTTSTYVWFTFSQKVKFSLLLVSWYRVCCLKVFTGFKLLLFVKWCEHEYLISICLSFTLLFSLWWKCSTFHQCCCFQSSELHFVCRFSLIFYRENRLSANVCRYQRKLYWLLSDHHVFSALICISQWFHHLVALSWYSITSLRFFLFANCPRLFTFCFVYTSCQLNVIDRSRFALWLPHLQDTGSRARCLYKRIDCLNTNSIIL